MHSAKDSDDGSEEKAGLYRWIFLFLSHCMRTECKEPPAPVGHKRSYIASRICAFLAFRLSRKRGNTNLS